MIRVLVILPCLLFLACAHREKGLSREQLHSAALKQAKQLHICFPHDDTRSNADLQTRLFIGAMGTVYDVRFEGESDLPAYEKSCVIDQMRAWSFPKVASGYASELSFLVRLNYETSPKITGR